MKFALIVALWLPLSISRFPASRATGGHPSSSPDAALKQGTLSMVKDYGRLPLSFEPNYGQFDPQVGVWYMGGAQGNQFQSWGWIQAANTPGWRAFGPR
jgi:hypothetical protein